MDQKIKALFQKNNLIFIATINSDGSPQLTPVWGNCSDDYILINTAEGRLKHQNVQNDQRAAVSVTDHDNPLNMTTIKGKVIQINTDYKYYQANEITKTYMGISENTKKKENEKNYR